MKQGTLIEKEKELKQAILIVDQKELTLLINACEEYSNAHKKERKIKELIKELNNVAIF